MLISKILVPVDFSEASLTALDEAIDLAAKLGASVVVEHVYQVPPLGPLVAGEFLAAPPYEHARSLADATEELRQVVEARANRGVRLRSVLREGHPSDVIDATAAEIGADLIVLGTREHGVLHALLGGTAERVTRTASMPVLTIRAST